MHFSSRWHKAFFVMDVFVISMLFVLLMTSLVLLVIDYDGVPKAWMDFSLNVFFYLAVVFASVGGLQKQRI